MTVRIAFGGLLLAALVAPAQAQRPLPQEVSDGFYVTVDEVRANSRETFMAFAGEDGGPISRQEFVETDLEPEIGPSGRNPEMLGRLFDLLDADDDGRLTRTEWQEQIERDVAFADENEDGRITLKELANARENMGIGDAVEMIF